MVYRGRCTGVMLQLCEGAAGLMDRPDLVNGGHAACLMVDGIERLLGGSRVMVDDLPTVGHCGVGPHKHDGSIGLHLLAHLLVCDALLHVKQEHPACKRTMM